MSLIELVGPAAAAPAAAAAILSGSMVFKWFSLIWRSDSPTGEEVSHCWETYIRTGRHSGRQDFITTNLGSFYEYLRLNATEKISTIAGSYCWFSNLNNLAPLPPSGGISLTFTAARHDALN